MRDRLPDLFDPREFAEKKRRIRGTLALDSLDRLREMLGDTKGEARFDLDFGKQGRIAMIEGRVEADLSLQCQRCLQNLSWPVRSDLKLGVVASLDEANLLAEEVEPLLVEPDADIALADIVQDELLLAIPPIPRHSDCRLPMPADAAETVKHPFAVLASLTKPTEE